MKTEKDLLLWVRWQKTFLAEKAEVLLFKELQPECSVSW